MKQKTKLKKLLNWDALLLPIIFLLMIIGFYLIVISGDSSNNIALGCGTGLISSGIVSLIIEITHIISTSSRNKKLRDFFYEKIKQFLSEFLYFASFFLEKENLSSVEMLKHQSEYYKKLSLTFDKLSQKKQTSILNDINFLVVHRKNFQVLLSEVNNRLFESTIHNIIDIDNEIVVEYIISDHNAIVDSINNEGDKNSIPKLYGYLLESVSILIERDKNLKIFKSIIYYKSKSDLNISGHLKKEDIKNLSETDKIFLRRYIDI